MKLLIEHINQMNKQEFVRAVGWVFEHSPWVAEKAWERLPVESRESLAQIMADIVQQSEDSRKVALLRAHPDLGTRLEISEVSKNEQAGVGLNQLSKDEFDEFVLLNRKYVETFAFPFIMAVKGQSKESILSAMKQRISNSVEKEFHTALNEVYKISVFRLNDIIQ